MHERTITRSIKLHTRKHTCKSYAMQYDFIGISILETIYPDMHIFIQVLIALSSNCLQIQHIHNYLHNNAHQNVSSTFVIISIEFISLYFNYD